MAAQSTFQRILYNQVSLIIAAISIAFAIYYTFSNPQKQSEIILAGVQAKLEQHEALQRQSDAAVAAQLELIRQGDLKDLKADMLENRGEVVSLQKEIVKLETIITERIPARK